MRWSNFSRFIIINFYGKLLQEAQWRCNNFRWWRVSASKTHQIIVTEGPGTLDWTRLPRKKNRKYKIWLLWAMRLPTKIWLSRYFCKQLSMKTLMEEINPGVIAKKGTVYGWTSQLVTFLHLGSISNSMWGRHFCSIIFSDYNAADWHLDAKNRADNIGWTLFWLH